MLRHIENKCPRFFLSTAPTDLLANNFLGRQNTGCGERKGIHWTGSRFVLAELGAESRLRESSRRLHTAGIKLGTVLRGCMEGIKGDPWG